MSPELGTLGIGDPAALWASSRRRSPEPSALSKKRLLSASWRDSVPLLTSASRDMAESGASTVMLKGIFEQPVEGFRR